MRIVIVGASRLGVALVEELLSGQHDVVLVDQSRDRLDEVSARLDCGFIEGDGTLPQILRDALGDGADALMLMTNHDDVNILAAVVGRSIGYDRIVLQIVRSELLDVCEELGFDDVITPHTTVAKSIVRSVESHTKVWDQLQGADDLQIGSYTVADRMAGQTLGDLDMPDGARAVARLREGEVASPGAQARLQAGDRVLIAATEQARGAVASMFDSTD